MIIVHKVLTFSLSRIWEYPIFKLKDITYWKTSNFKNISFIFGIGYGFCFKCLFNSLKSLIKFTRFYLGLGCAKDEAPHSGSFATSRNPSRTKCSTCFLKIYLIVPGGAKIVTQMRANSAQQKRKKKEKVEKRWDFPL